jgi:hypothetical protein
MNPEENTNLYRPDSDAETSGPTPKVGAKGSTITWTASEYIEHQRGPSWYGLLVLCTVALAAVTYLLTKDYFATGTIVVVGIIVAVFVGHKPQQVTYELNISGIKVGSKFYDYGSFKSFSITRDGLLNSLNLYPLKRFMPPIAAYFDAKDEERITNLVGDRLPLEEGRLDRIEQLSRRLKL